jgi:hypothetical protein
VPCYADRLKRWESFLFITSALRAYVEHKPFAIEIEPAWPLVIELASRQLVSPTIGVVLMHQQDVPDSIKDYFATVVALNRERNAILENAICDAIAALNRSNITPLLLKGSANLIEGNYRDPAARIMGDIDMLVQVDEIAAASEVLMAIGYTAVASPKRWILMTLPPCHLCMQVKADIGAGIELHYELVRPEYVQLIRAKDTIMRGLPRDRGGVRYLVLCPTDRLVHNIVHAHMHHPRQRSGLVDLRQMVDLCLLIDGCGTAIDWTEIEGRFALAGAAAVLRAQAALLAELFGRHVPIAGPGTTAAVARLWHAISNRPTLFTILGGIAAYYWAAFRRQPLLVANFLNPFWWPQRIRGWQAKYEEQS